MSAPPHAVLDALATCSRATLAFDLARIEANMRGIADAARAAEIRALFAVKSFPHPQVLALAAELLHGFDVASPGEVAAVPSGAILSIADPCGAAGELAAPAARSGRVIVACETVDQVRAAPPGAAIAIRICASVTGTDPAIGAVLDGTGHRRSRFGLVDRTAVAELAAVALAEDRQIGLHVHHGPVTATSADRFISTARAAVELAHEADVEPSFIDLGGAWHGIADLSRAFAAIRAALPGPLELIVEPGRACATAAGFACGIIRASRSLGGRELRVVDLSRTCHLRWSTVDLVARAPHPGTGRRVLVVGPTCYEEDVLGEWTIDPAELRDRIIVSGVSGYAFAWNTGFGGIPPAEIVVR